MGLFDTLLGEKLGSLVENVVKKVADPVASDTAGDPALSSSDQPRDKAWFAQLLADEFNGYEVRTDVPVSELGGEGRPYDFGLYSAGRCAGMVMLVEHNRDNNRAYRGAKQAAVDASVPFINFYLHMPNERDFVIGRIRRLAT